jgi:hypothetical protein
LAAKEEENRLNTIPLNLEEDFEEEEDRDEVLIYFLFLMEKLVNEYF